MTFYGCDFTCDERKQNIFAKVKDGRLLGFEFTQGLHNFASFLNAIQGAVGIDAPFGYSKAFLDEVNFGATWTEFASNLRAMGHQQVSEVVRSYRDSKPVGSKEPKRSTDTVANSCSSLKFYQVPVGRMAAKLIPILEESEASIFPVRPTSGNLTVFEVYPALASRHFEAIRYKNKSGLVSNREKILAGLDLQVAKSDRELILGDLGGDYLDSVIAACEARWAFERYTLGQLRIPDELDPREGWIVSQYLKL